MLKPSKAMFGKFLFRRWTLHAVHEQGAVPVTVYVPLLRVELFDENTNSCQELCRNLLWLV